VPHGKERKTKWKGEEKLGGRKGKWERDGRVEEGNGEKPPKTRF